MKNFLLIVITAVLSIFGYKYYEEHLANKIGLSSESAMIEEQLKNVSKLVVTEGRYTEVMNYEDSKDLFTYFKHDWLKSTKRAVIMVETDASVLYDLSNIDYIIDETTKTVTINSLPEPEIKLNPNIKYLDMKEGFFNEFEGDDYNAIKDEVLEKMTKKVEESSLKTNAENRLISELGKFLVLTNSMGWKLVYNKTAVEDMEDLRLERQTIID